MPMATREESALLVQAAMVELRHELRKLRAAADRGENLDWAGIELTFRELLARVWLALNPPQSDAGRTYEANKTAKTPSEAVAAVKKARTTRKAPRVR